jgi:hypothetical protein
MQRKFLALVPPLLLLALVPKTAHAWLGGFENADGYAYAFTYPQLDNYVDLTHYNAGQWGPNAGGGAAFQQAVNTPVALWSYSSVAGSAFPNAATRIANLGAAPPWNAYPAGATGSIPAYFVGAHFGGRLGTNALAIRNAATDGPLKYDYRIDSYDFGGVAPATVTSGTIATGFYYQPNPADNITDSSGQSPVKFAMSITDSTGNVGFEWGYLRDNTVLWRQGNANPWNTTTLSGDPFDYDGITFSVDLTAQTFTLDYYDISANLTTNLATNLALGATMTDFTHIGWYMTDNVYTGVGGKNFFDDFAFSVPEPASALLLLAALTPLLKKRRH